MKSSLFLVLLLTVSCGATLWQRPVESWQRDLAHGDTAALLKLSAKDLAADVGALGEGAAWNLGTVFWQAGKGNEAELLWKRSLAGENSPWREQAGLDLFDLYSARRDWTKAETVARKLLSFDAKRPAFQRRLFEAFYFQKQDDKAWPIFRSWKTGDFTPDEEKENQLFLGVLSARSGDKETASRVLKALVFDENASVLQFRLESFFQEDEARYELLGPGGREAVAFQSLVYRGVADDIRRWFRDQEFPAGFWNHRALIEGLEAAFKTDTRADTGLRLLEAVKTGLEGDARFAWQYARGRLYRALERWPEARAAFQTALGLARTAEDRKKTGWNWLNAWVQDRPSGALGPFLQVYASTDDPGYFTDVFAGWMTSLVQDRQWRILAAVWRDLGHRLAAEDRAMAGFVLARVASYGLVDLSRQGLQDTPSQLLEQVLALDPLSYEALVARAALGKTIEWPEAGPLSFTATDDSRRQVRLWDSMLAFGLAKNVGDQVAAWEGPLDPAFVDRSVVLLQSREQYRPSLQILYRLLREPGQVLTKPLAQKLYPLAYKDLITERAQDEGLDVSLLFGLIREESTFDPEARSWVGAQGLSQLMPATAAETAQRLRLKTYDLAKPADNLKLGARYLSTMIQSQGRIYLALMAYNAGGGRIRPWKEAMGKLPEEIFVEAAPITETRGYVKKILTSTVMTGVLHHGRTLEEMVKLIYPGFQP